MTINSSALNKMKDSKFSTTLGSMLYGNKAEKFCKGKFTPILNTKSGLDVHLFEQKESYEHGLVVNTVKRDFVEFSATDWVFNFCNNGDKNTLNLSEIMVLDIEIPLKNDSKILWKSLKGDDCSAESFMPLSKVLEIEDNINVSPSGGRPSKINFPFFDLSDESGNAIIAIGWTGQWKYEIKRNKESLIIKVGMESANFFLKAGECVRSPRILIMQSAESYEDIHNKFRKLMIKHFSPKDSNGSNFNVPIALQNFDRYVHNMPFWSTEEGQIKCVELAAKLEYFDSYWLDAGWFVGDFPLGVGNYTFKNGFPNGLSEISKQVHKNGLKFIVWFEPERVSEGTEVHMSHPEWLISDGEPGLEYSGKKQFIFNLGIPEARNWLIEHLSNFIKENGIDVYRQDFNIDPLEFWRNSDDEGREGLTQIKYVEGLYIFWDSIRERFPDLLIDNCSSGGMRIDIETCMRSVPLWRSDTGCFPMTDTWESDLWNQNQTISLSGYIPYHSTASWKSDVYEFRSAMTMGIAPNFDVLEVDFDFSKAKEALFELQQLKKYWEGDFYPLTEASLDTTRWAAFQFHLVNENTGMVLIFRRNNSLINRAKFLLKGINSKLMYKIILTDDNRNNSEVTLLGNELLEGLEVEIPNKKNSLVIVYSIDKTSNL